MASVRCRKISASNFKKVGNELDVQLLDNERVNACKKKRKIFDFGSTTKKKLFFTWLEEKCNDISNYGVELLSNL